jgi:hypothetical protein
MPGKYSALERYLQELPARQQGVVLTFQEVEAILNRKLPRSAYTYVKWWTVESRPRSPQKKAYIRAGWRLCSLSMMQQWIELVRQTQNESRPFRDGSGVLPGRPGPGADFSRGRACESG